MRLAFILSATLILFTACVSFTPNVDSNKPAPPSDTIAPEQKPAAPINDIKPLLKDVELYYDDGKARDYLCAMADNGYVIDFIPNATPFIVKKLRIYGALAGQSYEGKTFHIEIMDKGYRVIFEADYPVNKFMLNTPAWIVLDVPDLSVDDKFYVHVFTGTARLEGIHIGADDSIANLHSGISYRYEGVTRLGTSFWPFPKNMWFGDRSKVNWMIRVVGDCSEEVMNQRNISSAMKSDIQISTLNGTDRELATKRTLESLLAQYDVSKWSAVKSVVIEEGAIPHCCPLVLSTAYLPYDYLNLSTFIHEQLEMILSTKTAEMNQAIAELQQIYPEVPVDNTGFKSDKTAQGTYKHLALCFLEYSALKELTSEEIARSTMHRMAHYVWIYDTVLLDTDKIGEIVNRHYLNNW